MASFDVLAEAGRQHLSPLADPPTVGAAISASRMTSKSRVAQYSRRVAGESGRGWFEADDLRRVLPLFSLAFALVAAITQPSSTADLVLAAVPVAAFGLWAFAPKVPLAAVSVAIVVPVVVAQRSGQLEPVMFNVFCSRSGPRVGLGRSGWPRRSVYSRWPRRCWWPWCRIQWRLPAASGSWRSSSSGSLVGRSLATNDSWSSSRAPGVSWPSRRCSKSAVGSPVTSTTSWDTGWLPSCSRSRAPGTCCAAIPRPPRKRCDRPRRWAAAAWRSCVVRLRCSVTTTRRQWLRRSRRRKRSPRSSTRPLPGVSPSSCECEETSSRLSAGVGAALYRIAQEALANAARHAPRAQTVLGLELADRQVRLVAETSGPASAAPATDIERPRYGLMGMQERATALGGDLVAGPTPDGWRVTCRLPLNANDELSERDPGSP